MTESKVDAPDEQDSDHETILDEVCKELMQAIENKDKDQLLECFHCLVADLMDKLSNEKE